MNTQKRHVRIDLVGSHGKIEIDGHDIAYCVHELHIHGAADERTTVELRLVPRSVDFDGDATVRALLADDDDNGTTDHDGGEG
ncbi:MAG: hypothetical protein KJ056_10525 [Acidimicrobiia bacterium]|nr:hypothetical protein [Acidimicrobiia bacterium]